jgi:hypothetical protein
VRARPAHSPSPARRTRARPVTLIADNSKKRVMIAETFVFVVIPRPVRMRSYRDHAGLDNSKKCAKDFPFT